MSIRTVGVIGTGVIGASWIALFLAHGLKVIVADPAPGAEEKLKTYVEDVWPDLEKLGLKTGASLSNYRFVGPSLGEHYAEVDFVQENAPERLELKTKLFKEIDAAVRPDVVIASSSSGIPSSRFVTSCDVSPGRVLIGHPFNPPHLMPLVEMVPHPKTSSEAIDQAKAFYTSLGRRPVLIKKEVPGFAANRLQAALCGEAYSLVSRDVISAADLDACVTASLGPRWATVGPFMANAMGGGGGSTGFKHLLEYLGPAMRTWVDDMSAHSFGWTADEIDHLTTSIGAELEGKDVAALERARDAKLVSFLQLP